MHINLSLYCDDYIKKRQGKIYIFNIYYIFGGIIFQPSFNHYTAFAYNIDNIALNINNLSLYADDMKNKGEIKEIHFFSFENLINQLKNNYP